MRVSLNWVRDYVDIDMPADDLSALLTMSGTEVEAIEDIGQEWNQIVVGEIVSLKPHPQADNLSLCSVAVGSTSLSIVCGARNIGEGDRVPVAPVGAVLPGGTKIKKAKIRGETSEGMMCSEAELALGEDASGIMLLPSRSALGEPLKKALSLEDIVLELGVNPNRPDCLSVYGVTREIAALTAKELKPPSTDVKETGQKTSEIASVETEDPDLCPRYAARAIMNVSVARSPLWLRRRLEVSGVRSINNVVDVTNYVLLEMGQPLHAFDLDLLEGRRIVVRRARKGEMFETLDGVKRELGEDFLMICDGSRPVALGGIMGGLNSEVGLHTATVLLESAYFEPYSIRRTSKALGLRTEASQRFEKGVDPEGVVPALNRAAQLMCELAGGEVAQEPIDVVPHPAPPSQGISLDIGRTNHILGTQWSKQEVRGALERLQINVSERGNNKLVAHPPSYRVDLKQSIDLVEEVARLKGYDQIPSAPPKAAVASEKREASQLLEEQVRNLFSLQGYLETITYSFISPSWLDLIRLGADDDRRKYLRIRNPLSEEQSAMRTTLIPSLLNCMKENLNRKNSNLKLFEVGRVFSIQEGEELPAERKMVAGLLTGLAYGEAWNVAGDEVDFFDAKGTVESLVEWLHVQGVRFRPAEGIPYFRPFKACTIGAGNEVIGELGEIHPDVLDGFRVSQGAVVFELSLDSLLKHVGRETKVRPLSKFPPVYRDLALSVDETVPAEKVIDIIRKMPNEFIEEIILFDYYRGEQIEAGKKGLAYRVKFQAFDRNLTDKEVNQFREDIIAVLYREIGAKIRV
jgi:phenylalanyl-tRNA synthetase beta chain